MTHPQGYSAAVPTAHASRYLQQLCKHWAHKMAVEFDTERGFVPFPTAALRLEAGADSLLLTLTPTGEDDIAPLMEVVEKHLDRFAFREGALAYDWKVYNWKDIAPANS